MNSVHRASLVAGTDLFQSKEQLLHDEHDMVLKSITDTKSDDSLLEFNFSELQ